MVIRVSIGDLALIAGNMGSGERRVFGILNPKELAKGKRQYMALGGGAMLTQAGKDTLEGMLKATDFEQDKETGFFDARFKVDDEYIENALEFFKKPSPVFEHDPTLDILAELSGKEFPGFEGTILPPADIEEGVKVIFRYSVRQGVSEVGKDTSTRASADIPTRRLFRIFDLEMPPVLFEKFARSPMVRFLTEDELRTTDGGRVMGKTVDGIPIQNNLFLI